MHIHKLRPSWNSIQRCMMSRKDRKCSLMMYWLQACWQFHCVSQYAKSISVSSAWHKHCTTNSGQTELALLNQTLSDFAGIAQRELACIALQQYVVFCAAMSLVLSALPLQTQRKVAFSHAGDLYSPCLGTEQSTLTTYYHCSTCLNGGRDTV